MQFERYGPWLEATQLEGQFNTVIALQFESRLPKRERRWRAGRPSRLRSGSLASLVTVECVLRFLGCYQGIRYHLEIR